jgi:hypothetical protein
MTGRVSFSSNQEIVVDLLARMRNEDWHKREAGSMERDVYEWLTYTHDSLVTILNAAGVEWLPKP